MRAATPLADLDPLRSARPKPLRLIARADRAQRLGAQEGSIGAGELKTATYVAPVGRRHLIRTAAGDLVEVTGAQGSTTYSTGQAVTIGETVGGLTIIGSPPGGLVGASLFARAEISGDVDRPKVHSVEPAEIPPGVTAVTFRGVGFLETPVDVLTPIGAYFAGDGDSPPGYPIFTGATIGAVTWVSSTEIQADVTVTAAEGSGFGVRVDRA